MKILFLDIETAPHTAAVWGLWDQNVATNQIMEPGHTLCWAAKWLGSRTTEFHSVQSKGGRARMIARMHALLDEADAVCHYNGTKFDIPTLNKEFLLLGMKPPAPFKEIDLLRTCRRRFKLASNKLDYVASILGLGTKIKHKGMDLWFGCMRGDRASWKIMKRYNIQDVHLLEKLYKRLLPWIIAHPSHGALQGRPLCPSCGSSRLQRRGVSITATGRYARFQCQDCGTWTRGTKAEPKDSKDMRVAIK